MVYHIEITTWGLVWTPGRIYSMKPTTGLLAPGAHQVFIVKCLPTDVKAYKHNVKLKLNDMEKNTKVCW